MKLKSVLIIHCFSFISIICCVFKYSGSLKIKPVIASRCIATAWQSPYCLGSQSFRLPESIKFVIRARRLPRLALQGSQ